MAQPLPSSNAPPTRADLDALPQGTKGEIIDGVLYAMTRPRIRHQIAATSISSDLVSPFQRGTGGPGGWWIVQEPGIELPRSPEIAPDIAGWRRERMPSLPSGPVTLIPDWICEILSPTTRRHNITIKLPYYSKIGVPHAWVVDLDARFIQVLELSQGHWVLMGTYSDEANVRIAPFDAIEVDVSKWWEGIVDEAEAKLT